MRNKKIILILVGGLLLYSGPPAIAQDSASDEADVILAIEEQWRKDQDGDDWAEDSLSDDFSGWQKNAPVPRNKRSVKLWDRFRETQGRTVEHELYFQSVIIHGDVAVAHYLYTAAFQNKEKETTVKNGRYTDVLIRTDDGWKFLAWHGGDDD